MMLIDKVNEYTIIIQSSMVDFKKLAFDFLIFTFHLIQKLVIDEEHEK